MVEYLPKNLERKLSVPSLGARIYYNGPCAKAQPGPIPKHRADQRLCSPFMD